MKKLLIFLFAINTAYAQNVGVSNSLLFTPTERLDVDGNLRVIGRIDINDANTRILEGSGNAIRLQTNSGYIELGPQNTVWSHIMTDRPRFYLNRGISVDEGFVGSYDEDLSLQTSGVTRITILNANGNVGIGTAAPGYKLHVPSGYIGTDYLNTTDNAVGSGVTGVMIKAGDNYLRTGNAAAVSTFLNSTIAATYANLTGIPVRTAWSGVHRNFVAEQLSWKNYGNGHTIFDASQSTSPNGTAVNNTNAQVPWSASYPTLMGWNGANTYGVRVDIARYAESAPGDNLGNHVATTTLNMNGNVINNFRRIEPLGIGGDSGEGANAYAIFQEGGTWTHPYPDLRIAYHTGIKLGANASYNGIRFYTDYDMSSLVMSVNDGSTSGASNVYMSGNLGIRITPTVPIDISGAGLAGNGGIRVKFGWYTGSEPVVNPSTPNWGYVGTSSEYWYQMYSRYYNAANGYYYFSDNSLKTNVRPVVKALDKIMSIQGVTYDIIEGSVIWNDKNNAENFGQVGFIAQEVQKVLPNLVKTIDGNISIETSGDKNNANTLLSVDYGRIIPYLIEAIKEQQTLILQLNQRLTLLEQ